MRVRGCFFALGCMQEYMSTPSIGCLRYISPLVKVCIQMICVFCIKGLMLVNGTMFASNNVNQFSLSQNTLKSKSMTRVIGFY